MATRCAKSVAADSQKPLEVHTYLVESWQDPFQPGAVEEVLQVGHNAMQQHVWLSGHQALSSCDGVSSSQAGALMLHQLPHRWHQLTQANLHTHTHKHAPALCASQQLVLQAMAVNQRGDWLPDVDRCCRCYSCVDVLCSKPALYHAAWFER